MSFFWFIPLSPGPYNLSTVGLALCSDREYLVIKNLIVAKYEYKLKLETKLKFLYHTLFTIEVALIF
jgi:hypothetical protein